MIPQVLFGCFHEFRFNFHDGQVSWIPQIKNTPIQPEIKLGLDRSRNIDRKRSVRSIENRDRSGIQLGTDFRNLFFGHDSFDCDDVLKIQFLTKGKKSRAGNFSCAE